MTVKLLTEHHLEFLNIKGHCTGSSQSTLVKKPHCWKSHVAPHLYYYSICLAPEHIGSRVFIVISSLNSLPNIDLELVAT